MFCALLPDARHVETGSQSEGLAQGSFARMAVRSVPFGWRGVGFRSLQPTETMPRQEQS